MLEGKDGQAGIRVGVIHTGSSAGCKAAAAAAVNVVWTEKGERRKVHSGVGPNVGKDVQPMEWHSAFGMRVGGVVEQLWQGTWRRRRGL